MPLGTAPAPLSSSMSLMPPADTALGPCVCHVARWRSRSRPTAGAPRTAPATEALVACAAAPQPSVDCTGGCRFCGAQRSCRPALFSFPLSTPPPLSCAAVCVAPVIPLAHHPALPPPRPPFPPSVPQPRRPAVEWLGSGGPAHEPRQGSRDVQRGTAEDDEGLEHALAARVRFDAPDRRGGPAAAGHGAREREGCGRWVVVGGWGGWWRSRGFPLHGWVGRESRPLPRWRLKAAIFETWASWPSTGARPKSH